MKPGSHIYLMGICGTAMASLAGLLKSQGYQVTGSDSHPYPPMSTQLAELGILVHDGYRAENLNPKPDFVIVGNVISREHPEVTEMQRLNIPYTSLPKCLGETLLQHRETLVVAGTHGKTTTTSLLAWVLTELGQDPSFLVGGIPKNFSRSFHLGKGNHFVIEGDEYDTAFFDKVPKFTHYFPKHAILTSVEFDHADIYQNLDQVKAAFRLLLAALPPTALLVAHAQDSNIDDLLKEHPGKVIRFGTTKGDWQARDLNFSLELTEFTVLRQGQELGRVAMRLPGEFNVMNALAVIALTDHLGFAFAKVAAAIASFTGVKRRQEIIGQRDGMVIIEDFAHHPTAVKATLEGLRKRFQGRRLVAVFEPRSATSRRKVFQKDFAKSLSLADAIFVSEPFDQSRIAEADRFSSAELVTDIVKQTNAGTVVLSAAPEKLLGELMLKTQPNDVVVFMSNGGFAGIHHQFAKGLVG